MGTVLALAQKDLRILLRQRAAVFFSLVWPLLVAVLFGIIFAGPGETPSKIRIAVVDEDGTSGSADFAARLRKNTNFETAAAGRDDAARLVRQGKQTAAIVITSGFGDASERVFYGSPPKLEKWQSPQAPTSIVVVYSDENVVESKKFYGTHN